MKKTVAFLFIMTIVCWRAPLAAHAGCTRGDCKNGVGIWEWDSGNKYVGAFKDGKRTGHGTFTFSNGDKYTGDFVDGKFQGHGKYTYADGDVYEGQWQNGKMAGKGVLQKSDGTKQEGDYRDGAPVETWKADTDELNEPDGKKYPRGYMEKLTAEQPDKKTTPTIKKPVKK